MALRPGLGCVSKAPHHALDLVSMVHRRGGPGLQMLPYAAVGTRPRFHPAGTAQNAQARAVPVPPV